MEAAIILGTFFLLIAVGAPIMVALMASSLFSCWYLKLAPVLSLGQAAFESLYSFTITAVPFYVFAGVLMSEGKIAEKLVDLAYSFVSKITGGLGIVTALAGAFFAAISGSSTATTAAIGSTMAHEMETHGYDKDYALAVSAASGVVGPIIPPSIGFVLFGVSTGTSISDLFIGGVIPGILLTISLMLAIYFTSRRRGYFGKGLDARRKSVMKAVWDAKYAILVPILILGGIYSGFFTPTEAGAVACVYAIVVTLFVERTMKFMNLFRILGESALTSSVIMMMVVSATMFGKVMTLAQVPQSLAAGIMEVSANAGVCILLINLLLLVVGCVMDAAPAILILAPLLLPVAQSFGFSALHFGIIMCMNLAIGSITPPVGCCLFAASIIGNTPIERIARKALPFLGAQLACLVVIILAPGFCTLLPSLLR